MMVSAMKRVGILHSEVKREYFSTEQLYITEKDAVKDAKIIAKYLERLGIEPILIPCNARLAEAIHRLKPDMVINVVGTVRGYDYLAATVPAVLELLEVPYTGAGVLGESLGYNKFLVKKLLEQSGLPVPHYQLFTSCREPIDSTLRYPLISKLNEIHGAVEINKNSISENENHLRARLKFLIDTYEQPILVEEFIAGREITAILLEGLNKKVYLAERILSNSVDEKYSFVNFNLQWSDKEFSVKYRRFKEPIVNEYVKKAFEIAKMSDYGKFDLRLDASGRYFFVDANSNPAFGPKESFTDIANILDIYGISFVDVLKRLIANTMRDAMGKKLLPIPK